MNTTTESLRTLVWDGPLGIQWGVLIALILGALITWLLRQERDVLGYRYVRLFWVLRIMALLSVLWMLLAPNRVQTTKTTINQTIAIAADISPSMGIIDAPDTSDDVRWGIAGSKSIRSDSIEAADRAVVSAKVVVDQLRSAQNTLQSQGSLAVTSELVAQAIDSLERVKEHLQVIAQDSARPERTRELLRLVDDESFHQINRQMKSNRRWVSVDWGELLGDASYNAMAIERRMIVLANQIRGEQESRIAQLHPTELTQLRRRSRFEKVAHAIDQLELDNQFDPSQETLVRYYGFDSAVRQLGSDLKPDSLLSSFHWDSSRDSQVTDFDTSLEQIKQRHSDGHLAAIVVYSDAVHSAAAPLRASMASQETPLYLVPVGNPNHVRDVAIQGVLAPGVVMQNDSMLVEVDVQTYDCEGETCTVELIEGERTLAHQSVKIQGDGRVQRVKFNIQISDFGHHEFDVRVVPIKNEHSEDNNSESFEVNVTRSKIRVLLTDQIPRWEYRYLTQLFRRDPKIEADELLFEPRTVATGLRKDAPAFPRAVEDWARYDAVILGDVESKNLSPASQESLIDYLRDFGGSLILIAGPQAMPEAYSNQPLQKILPVQRLAQDGVSRDGYSLEVTELGSRHQALMITQQAVSTQAAWDLVNRNTPTGWLSPFRKPRSTTRVLIEARPRQGSSVERQAFLCWQPVGRGRVIYFSGPETYRLRYLRGDRYHFRLWGQLLRWSIASELSQSNRFVKLRSDKNRYDENEEIVLWVQLVDQNDQPVGDKSISAVATGDDGTSVTVPLKPDPSIPGRYQGETRNLSPGRYEWQVDGVEEIVGDERSNPIGRFLVRSFVSQELVDTRCDFLVAQKLADASGGQVVPPTAVAEVIKSINLAPIVKQTTKATPLWLRWELLCLIVISLGTEWVIRKGKGYC